MKNIVTFIINMVCAMLTGTRFAEISAYIVNSLKKENIECSPDMLACMSDGLTKVQNKVRRAIRLASRHIDLDIKRFDKPLMFYAYTSSVVSSIIYIDTWNEMTLQEKEIVDYIDDLFDKANKLNKRNWYCSTRKDNKTVIAMCDHNGSILYFGRYDGRYSVGLGVYTEFGDGRQAINIDNAW